MVLQKKKSVQLGLICLLSSLIGVVINKQLFGIAPGSGLVCFVLGVAGADSFLSQQQNRVSPRWGMWGTVGLLIVGLVCGYCTDMSKIIGFMYVGLMVGSCWLLACHMPEWIVQSKRLVELFGMSSVIYFSHSPLLLFAKSHFPISNVNYWLFAALFLTVQIFILLVIKTFFPFIWRGLSGGR